MVSCAARGGARVSSLSFRRRRRRRRRRRCCSCYFLVVVVVVVVVAVLPLFAVLHSCCGC